MFAIVVYDVNIKRTAKVMKICRKYLEHVQKSVFEGNITESKLNKLKREISQIIDKEEDGIIIYKFETLKYSSKEVIGLYNEKSNYL